MTSGNRPIDLTARMLADVGVDYLLGAVNEHYIQWGEPPPSIIVTEPQAKSLRAEAAQHAPHANRPGAIDSIWGVPLEVVGLFPFLVGGPLHGHPLPALENPHEFHYATFARGSGRYERRVMSGPPSADVRLIFYLDVDTDLVEGTRLLWTELLRRARFDPLDRA